MLKAKFLQDLCKGCARCVPACPQNCIALKATLNSKRYTTAILKKSEKCKGCGICVMMCPENAIVVGE